MAAGLAATPLHAQVRDTARAAARTGTGRATAQARAAQDTTARDTVAPVKPLPLSGTIVLSASLGRLSFGAFQTQGVELSALDSLGNALETQSFERTLGAGGAYSAAMGVTYWATERWGARIEAGWSRPRLAASLSRAGQAYRFQHGGTGEPAAAFPLLSAAAEALFRLPIRHPVYTPYVLAGAGLRRYGAVSDTTALPAGGRTAFTRPRIVFMTLFGLGALVRLHGDHWLLQVEFQHRLAPTPIAGWGSGEIQRSDSLLIAFPAAAPAGDPTLDTAGSTRLSVGVAYALPLHAPRGAGTSRGVAKPGPS